LGLDDLADARVSRDSRIARHVIGRVGGESFQAVTCTGTDINQTHKTNDIIVTLSY